MKNTEEIKALKAKYGRVFQATVGEFKAILRYPNRKDLAYASAGAGGNVFKVNEILFEQCWIEGDTQIKEDVALFLSAVNSFSEIIQIKETEIKEL